MKIAVCYKWVPDEADIRIEEENLSLNFDKVKYKISDYDRNAIELGATIKEAIGAGTELVGVTCGSGVEKSLKDALSRGIDSVYYVDSKVLADVDSQVTSKILAAIIKKIGDVDLIICGEGSSDNYSQQVGPRLSVLLGCSAVTFANKVDVDGSGLKAERKLEDGIEVVQSEFPAVITVLPDINEPRIPGLKQILAAKKKPSYALSLADIGIDDGEIQKSITTINLTGSVMDRKNIKIGGEGVSAIDAIEELLKKVNFTINDN